MANLYAFPGQCRQPGCQRDSHQCDIACNKYAIIPDEEFLNNNLREEHLLSQITTRISEMKDIYSATSLNFLKSHTFLLHDQSKQNDLIDLELVLKM